MTVKRVIDYHFAGDGAEGFSDSDSGVMELSLSLDIPGNMKTGKKESLKKKYQKFLDFWNGTEEDLVQPEAFFSLVPADKMETSVRQWAEEVFSSRGTSLADVICIYAVWTIGPELEKAASRFFEDGQSMNGVFTDIAGSTILLQMHDEIKRWLRSLAAVYFTENIILELYPGNNMIETVDLNTFIETVGAGKVIKASEEGSMLIPRKSMYSFFFIGDGPENMLTKRKRCAECKGLECLYAQLGGCHYREAG